MGGRRLAGTSGHQSTTEPIPGRRDDLLSGLLDAAEGDDRRTPEEIVGVLILLVGAGIETSMLLLGNAWHAAQIADYEIDEPGIRRIHSSNDRGFSALLTRVTPRR